MIPQLQHQRLPYDLRDHVENKGERPEGDWYLIAHLPLPCSCPTVPQCQLPCPGVKRVALACSSQASRSLLLVACPVEVLEKMETRKQREAAAAHSSCNQMIKGGCLNGTQVKRMQLINTGKLSFPESPAQSVRIPATAHTSTPQLCTWRTISDFISEGDDSLFAAGWTQSLASFLSKERRLFVSGLTQVHLVHVHWQVQTI